MNRKKTKMQPNVYSVESKARACGNSFYFFFQIVCTYRNFPNKKWGQLYRLETLEDTLANNSKKES